jgi:hypothetical protein
LVSARTAEQFRQLGDIRRYPREPRSNCDLLITRLMACRDFLIRHHALRTTNQNGGITAKSKKRAKVQKGGKLPRGKSATRGKARKAVQAKTVARAKPKKAARKVKQPVTPVVETVAAEVIEQPAPGVITVMEVEETEVRQVN